MEAFFLREAKEADGGDEGGGGGDVAAAGGVFTTFLTFGTVLVFFRPRPLSENAKNTHTLLNNASKDLVQVGTSGSHSSKIKALCLMKLSYTSASMLQYFWNMKTCSFFSFR